VAARANESFKRTCRRHNVSGVFPFVGTKAENLPKPSH
jgi:hypothetical protein